MNIRQTAVAVLAACAALEAFAEKQPYERYKPIVERQMFGPLPEGFDPTKMPSEVARSSGGKQERELTKEQEKLQSAVRFSAINVTPEGETAVGFTDNSDPKVPVHYYLKVGEERGGWKVESADPKTATMTIVKNDIEITLTIGGSSGKGGGSHAKRGTEADGAAAGATLGGRRMLRRKRDAAEIEKLRAEQEARDAEREAKAAEEKAQREAEREEQRQQFLAIQEELRKSREAAAKAKEASKEGAEDENNNAE